MLASVLLVALRIARVYCRADPSSPSVARQMLEAPTASRLKNLVDEPSAKLRTEVCGDAVV